MLIDLNYALGQLRGCAGRPVRSMEDRVQRAIDAIERAIEVATRLEADIDARLEAMDGDEADLDALFADELVPCEVAE